MTCVLGPIKLWPICSSRPPTAPDHKARAHAMLRPRSGTRSSFLKRFGAALGAGCLLIFAASSAGAEFNLFDRLAETKIEQIEKFVAAEAFKVGRKIGGRTLSAVGLNFSQSFLGIVEENVPAISLSGSTLRYTMGDKSLIKALGGEDAVLPFLAYVYRLMEMGVEGPSHTDWQSNLAYVRSPIDQRLWAVHWTVNYSGEWNIGATYVPHQHLDWRLGSRLFSKLRISADTDATEPLEVQRASSWP